MGGLCIVERKSNAEGERKIHGDCTTIFVAMVPTEHNPDKPSNVIIDAPSPRPPSSVEEDCSLCAGATREDGVRASWPERGSPFAGQESIGGLIRHSRA